MMKTRIILALLSMTTIAGCSSARETLGIGRSAPDEFSVIKQAPLEMPNGLALPPPRPGQPRPQEIAATEQAKGVIFGQESTAQSATQQASTAESVLLQKSGAGSTDPNIRAELDAESAAYAEQNKPVVKKLLGLGGAKTENTEEALNPKLEAERLRKNNLPAPIPPADKKD